MSQFRRLVNEAHRRSIWQVLAIYCVGAWVVYQIVLALDDGLGLPEWVPGVTIILFLIGLPVVFATAFVQEGGPSRDALRKADYFDPTLHPGFEEQQTQPTTGPTFIERLLTWRRSLGAGIAAFALLVLATAAFIGMRNLGIGPFGTLTAQGVLDQRDRIVLADFASPASDTALGRVVTEALRIDLLQSDFVRLVDPRQLADALRRMQRDPAAGLPQDVARDLAVREGLKAIVVGEVSQVGGGYVLSGQLQTAQDGSSLVALREVARDSTQLLDAIERFSKTLRERIGESLKSLSASEPLWAVSTASLPALRKYSEAMRVQAETGDELRVVGLLEESIALDSTFAMAHRKASNSYGNIVGGGNRARQVHAASRAYQLRDRLPEKERYLTIGTYEDLVRGDRARAIEAYRAVLELDADDFVTLNNLPLLLDLERDYTGAEELYRRGAELHGGNFHFNNLIGMQYRLGKRVEALATLDRALQTLAGNETVEFRRVLFPQAERKWLEAETAAREHLRKFERNRSGRLRALLALRQTAAVQGKVSSANRHGDEYERTVAQEGNRAARLQSRLNRASITLAIIGDTAKAVGELEDALRSIPLDQLDPLDRPYLALAEFLTNANRPDRAERLLADYETSVPGDERGRTGNDNLRAVRARLAFDRQPSAASLDEVRRTEQTVCALCGTLQLGAAYDRLGQTDSAIATYERFLSAPVLTRLTFDHLWLARTYLRLGELYEARKEYTKAGEYYARYVELWKDADPELQPRVQSIRRRLEDVTRKRG